MRSIGLLAVLTVAIAAACTQENTGQDFDGAGGAQGATDGGRTPAPDRGLVGDASQHDAAVVPGCTPEPEICDGEDNNCDGEIDEMFGLGRACTVGQGACAVEGVIACAADGDIECQGEPGQPGEELCNGIDDDCDGQIDQGLGLGERCELREGTCRSTGTTVCGPDLRPMCDAEPIEITDERCNGRDDDCDGETDEGFNLGSPCESGLGICAVQGRTICAEDGGATCGALPGPPAEEICNNLDDDCDGEIDEGFDEIGTPCALGVGACLAEGQMICTPRGGLICDARPAGPVRELCNGLDDDCDGETDEDFSLGEACVSGVGACEVPGETACAPADGPRGLHFEGIRQNLPEADLLDGGFELCWSGRYNASGPAIADILRDCGGDVLALGCRNVGAPNLTLAAMGERADVIFDVGNRRDGVHNHNGVDWYFSDSYSWGFAAAGTGVSRNSCDTGQVQPDLRMCWHTGQGQMNPGYRCGANQNGNQEKVIYHRPGPLGGGPRVICDAEPGPPGVEICNGVDDDCDGEVDEGFPVGTPCEEGVGFCEIGTRRCGADEVLRCDVQPAEPEPERCDGIDNDCNGTVDDAPGVGEDCVSGLGICERPGTTTCAPPGGPRGLHFQGIRQNVPLAELTDGDFEICFTGAYDANGPPVADVLAACDGEVLAMGCRPAGADVLNLAAMGERAEVLADMGNRADGVHSHNGVGWYFSDSYSWGFAPDGLPVARNSCDTAGQQPELRMCWHTGAGRMNAGWGCGPNRQNRGWEKVILQRSGPLEGGPRIICDAIPGDPEPEACNALDDDCDGEIDEDFPLGSLCADGVGLCEVGHFVCEPGGPRCDVQPLVPEPERCDGIDNDCNGTIDDAPGVGEECVSGLGICERPGLSICAPPDAPRGLHFAGIRQDLPIAELDAGGFVQCFAGGYDANGPPVADVLAACDGEVLLLGCRPAGADALNLAAMGERAEVLADMGNRRDGVHSHNGVGWYFSDSYSWGFAPDGLPVSRNSCDTEGQQAELRMCWHTGAGRMNPGWSCGPNRQNGGWQKVIFQREGPLEGGLPIVCDAPPGLPDPAGEVCNNLDDDCDGEIDEGFDVGQPCSVGVGACRADGQVICDAAGVPGCSAVEGLPAPEVCNGVDDDCDGMRDEDLMCPFFRSCLGAQQAGANRSGLFQLSDDAGERFDAWCDLETDGGGWTLVASTAGETLNDQGSAYYADLQTLAPAAAHLGVWGLLLGLSDTHDLRFACRENPGAADAAMTVDLSFYDVIWYGEIAGAANDAASCFNENNGMGQEQIPARRNNLTGALIPENDQWNSGALEGEDACGDENDFTVDFDDRGMDSNQGDGTDWGEDDGTRKCGRDGLAGGQWFIFARERPVP